MAPLRLPGMRLVVWLLGCCGSLRVAALNVRRTADTSTTTSSLPWPSLTTAPPWLVRQYKMPAESGTEWFIKQRQWRQGSLDPTDARASQLRDLSADDTPDTAFSLDLSYYRQHDESSFWRAVCNGTNRPLEDPFNVNISTQVCEETMARTFESSLLVTGVPKVSLQKYDLLMHVLCTRVLQTYGPCNVYMPENTYTHSTLGYAIVTYCSPETAITTLNNFHDYDFDPWHKLKMYRWHDVAFPHAPTVLETEQATLPQGWYAAVDPSSGNFYYYQEGKPAQWIKPRADDLER